MMEKSDFINHGLTMMLNTCRVTSAPMLLAAIAFRVMLTVSSNPCLVKMMMLMMLEVMPNIPIISEQTERLKARKKSNRTGCSKPVEAGTWTLLVLTVVDFMLL